MRALRRTKLVRRRITCHDLYVKYKKGSSTTHRVLIHLIFCPKYRRRILIGKVSKRIRGLFQQACEINKWEIEELGVQKDHVHMLIQINPRDSISKVVQLLKGGSSRVIRKEYPELEEFLWGDSFWSDGYFAESIGSKSETTMRRYIKEQNKS